MIFELKARVDSSSQGGLGKTPSGVWWWTLRIRIARFLRASLLKMFKLGPIHYRMQWNLDRFASTDGLEAHRPQLLSFSIANLPCFIQLSLLVHKIIQNVCSFAAKAVWSRSIWREFFNLLLELDDQVIIIRRSNLKREIQNI